MTDAERMKMVMDDMEAASRFGDNPLLVRIMEAIACIASVVKDMLNEEERQRS